MNATVTTAAPKQGVVASFLARHVTEKKTLCIEEPEGSDMNSPSIQTTKTHVALLIPKNMLWLFLLGGLVGGPSLLSYAGNRAGLVTKDDLKLAIRSAVEEAMKPIDERIARLERANKASKATKEASNDR